MPNRRLFAGLILMLAIAMASCVSVPQESAQLSIELGQRINGAKQAHLALARNFVAEKRERIDEFMAREYIPAYMKNAFANDFVANKWNQAVRTTDDAMRLELITEISANLQKGINAKRQQFMKPVDEMEQLLLQRISEHYDEMVAANAALTSYLDSAISVKDRQGKVLDSLNIKGDFSAYMTKADDLIGMITSGTNSLKEHEGDINKILEWFRKGKQGGT